MDERLQMLVRLRAALDEARERCREARDVAHGLQAAALGADLGRLDSLYHRTDARIVAIEAAGVGS